MRPPERETGPVTGTGTHQDAKSSTQSSGKALVWIPCIRSYPQDTASQLRRRQEAARRLPRICDRCGANDAISCRCHNPDPPLSEHALNAWRSAAKHVLETGQTPILPIEVLQLFWRKGGPDRPLAQRVWDQMSGLIA
jgi:hypothetical protein